MEGLLTRPEWYVLGPLIGLVVVGLLAFANRRIGALGGYSAVVEGASGREPGLDWRAAFLGGIFLGALSFSVAAGGVSPGDGYGWLTRTFDSGVLVVAVLIGGGALIGYGAKLAGGCTSGNGLGGCSAGSPASFAATATFMATAIAVTFAIEAVIS